MSPHAKKDQNNSDDSEYSDEERRKADSSELTSQDIFASQNLKLDEASEDNLENILLDVETLKGLDQWHLDVAEKDVFNKLVNICRNLTRKESDLKLLVGKTVNEEQAVLNTFYVSKLLKDINFQESNNKVAWDVHELKAQVKIIFKK